MQNVHRKAALILGGAALLTASAPTLATAVTKASEVIVRNTTSDPAIVQSVGTTQVAGDVAVPGGVAVTNEPTVKVDDATPLAVTSAAPERFQLGVEASTTTTSAEGEQCSDITPPEGKRYVIEAAHLEGRFSGDAKPGLGYVRVSHIVKSEGSISVGVVRIAPEWRETFASDRFAADVEGPYIADGSTRELAFCVQILGAGTAILRGTVNGTVENL